MHEFVRALASCFASLRALVAGCDCALSLSLSVEFHNAGQWLSERGDCKGYFRGNARGLWKLLRGICEGVFKGKSRRVCCGNY